MARARDEGVALTGEGGLLTGMIRQVLQTALLHWRKDSSRRVVEYLNRYPVTDFYDISWLPGAPWGRRGQLRLPRFVSMQQSPSPVLSAPPAVSAAASHARYWRTLEA